MCCCGQKIMGPQAAVRPQITYIQQLSENAGCHVDPQTLIEDRERLREVVRVVQVTNLTG